MKHTPDTALKLAGVFIAIKDYRVCSELIWLASSMALKNYAKGYARQRIHLGSHNSKSKFCTELLVKIGHETKKEIIAEHWDIAEK